MTTGAFNYLSNIIFVNLFGNLYLTAKIVSTCNGIKKFHPYFFFISGMDSLYNIIKLAEI
jgi:hypothetical protein